VLDRESKLAWRKYVAALPVGGKLWMLEETIAETRAIVATHPPKSANPARPGWIPDDSTR
jgi:hypothetical protein